MADETDTALLVSVISGVAALCVFIAAISYLTRKASADEEHDSESTLGDFPKVPEFINRRRDDE